ncbi:TPA: hypothetical protein ACU20B_005733, partial [Escherichia coli]
NQAITQIYVQALPLAGSPASRRLPGKRVLCGTIRFCSLSLCGSRFALCPNHSQNFYTHFSLNFPWQFIPAGQL